MGQNVTVIIAAYNASATIARALRSAFEQPDVAEIMVIDDASTDNTAALARAADDGTGRLRVLVQAKNSGPSAARNRAIAESVSPWIAILDADDFFLPGRIAGLLGYAQDADMVADDMWQVTEGREDGPRRNLLDNALTLPCMVSLRQFVLSNITLRGRSRGELGFIKPIMRRSFLEAHHLHYREEMRLGEDYELYARALAHGARLKLVPAQGYVSVVRENSLSGLHSEQDLQNLRDCNLSLMKLPLGKEDRAALNGHYKSVDCRLQWRNLILAVKAKDLVAALGCFAHPWPVPLYLAEQLGGQLYLRTIGRVFSGERK
ncbi:MAG: glucosyltransferase protein [Micavibrio sp.]|nr:glucosyltransferase protein [Micavibrio sp.]